MAEASVRADTSDTTSYAAGLQVSPSNASRICDRLLKIGMVDRRDDPGEPLDQHEHALV
ncbi:MAG: hypothetical protein ACXVGO_02820 [Mycobacterium sp.]